MRTRYLVTYDICDPARLREVYQTMRGFGAHLQYSVFRCDLSDVERIEMIGVLGAIINHADDQVLIIDLGPPEGRGRSCFQAVGRPYVDHDPRPVVI